MTKRIFPATEPWAVREAAVIEQYQRAKVEDPLFADRYPQPETYRCHYDDALKRLDQLDMLPLDQAAARMNITPAALLRKADRGQTVLIEIEGVQVVPDWIAKRRGKALEFHLDVAREFSKNGQREHFKFMNYLNFMGGLEQLEFKAPLPQKSVKDVFRAVGITQGTCQVLVCTPMFEAADRSLKNRAIMIEFVNRMAAALTVVGGMGDPKVGGVSDQFLDRYVPLDMPGRDRWKIEIR